VTVAMRPPAVAGAFYTADPAALAAEIDGFVRAAHPFEGPPPKALVVPHAGYRYSGPVAGTGYAAVAPLAGTVTRVVLLGPAHRVALRGMAVPSVDAFSTPLGDHPIDQEAREIALGLPGVVVDDLAHRDEHSLEVHVPFLQRLLPGSALLPVVVGRAPTSDVADLLDALWGGRETLVVVSSDLSHYERYDDAAAHDAATAQAIVAGRGELVGPEDACGCYPLRGLLEVVRRRGLAVRVLDLRSSGDTAGPRDQVVGYGTFAVCAP
jgi:AmmeMemoRadiSam system protein B